jgi:hypothetical protein
MFLPDRRGLINEIDSASLVEFKKLRTKVFQIILRLVAKPNYIRVRYLSRAPILLMVRWRHCEALKKYPDRSLWIKFEQVKKINTIVLPGKTFEWASELSRRNWNY